MAIISQKNLFNWKEVEASSDLDLSAVAQAGRLSLVLEAIGDEGLMQISEKKRKGKRNDYPIRAVWNSILAGIVYIYPVYLVYPCLNFSLPPSSPFLLNLFVFVFLCASVSQWLIRFLFF